MSYETYSDLVVGFALIGLSTTAVLIALAVRRLGLFAIRLWKRGRVMSQ